MKRANDDPRSVAQLGEPISAGWFVKGYIHGDETGWSEGQLWIPISGPKGEGTIYARAGRAYGPWVFSELQLNGEDGKVIDLLERSAKSSPASLTARYRVLIVPIGRVRELGLHELPEFYRRRLGLHVELSAPIALEEHARDPERNQLIVEELVALMRRRLPSIASDKSALLIGITAEDMYIRDLNWNFAYTAYQHEERAAVVSSARFTPFLYRLRGKGDLLKARVRKMVSRTIGVMVYGLPESDDPTSLMYRDLYGPASADLMSESFEGLGSLAVVDEFRSAHGMQPREPELIPGISDFDEAKVDGRYPCLQLKRQRDTGAAIPSFDVTIGKCVQQTFLHANSDEIEVDLRSGLLVTRRTDFFIPGAIPIAATRCYRLWDGHSRTFGQHTTLSWDMYPIGSRQPYTYMDVILCDGSRLHYDRISKGTGYADARYEHRQTATPFLRSQFAWNGNGWDLKMREGPLLLFPESYHGKKPVDGALIGLRDSDGQAVKIERNERRNLKRLTAPSGRFIRFDYDTSGRIIKAADDEEREAKYYYDAGGRLAQVQGPKSVIEYSYEGSSVTSIKEDGVRVVEFQYGDWGRIERIALPDRQSYLFRYEYNPHNESQVIHTFVTRPSGSVIKFDIKPK